MAAHIVAVTGNSNGKLARAQVLAMEKKDRLNLNKEQAERLGFHLTDGIHGSLYVETDEEKEARIQKFRGVRPPWIDVSNALARSWV